MATIVSTAFGGKKKEEVHKPQNREQMVSAFNSVFGAS